MNIKSLLTEMLITFIAAFVVAALVTFLWNSLRHGTAVVDWDTVFTLSIIFTVVVPLANALKQKNKDNTKL